MTLKQKSKDKWKNGNENTHRNDCEQSRDWSEKKRRRYDHQWSSEGGGRDKLKNVDGDFPACMRLKKENMEDNKKTKA